MRRLRSRPMESRSFTLRRRGDVLPDLHRESGRQRLSADHVVEFYRHRAEGESQDRERIVFSSGRSGPQQIYRMNMDGADVERLTRRHGRSIQPVLASRRADHRVCLDARIRHREVQHLHHGCGVAQVHPVDARRGQERKSQLGAGRQAPGFHVDAQRQDQIWTMLADGTQVQQLTTQGSN